MASPRLLRRQSMRALAAVTAVVFAAPHQSAAAQTQPPATRTIAIPGLPLADALAEFSRVTGVVVRAEPAVLVGKRAPALAGRYAPLDALTRLLQGTGLTAVQAADGTVSVQLPGATTAASVAPLAAVKVVSGANARAVAADAADLGVLGTASIMQTPFTMNVVTRAALDAQQSTFLGEVIRNEPAAVVSNVPVGFVTLRGFAVSTDGFLYDGLLGHIGLSDGRGQIEGVDRVEVLKGPSAFLYGIGATASLGGTLNYLPKSAPNERVRQFEANYAGRSVVGAHLDVGDRIGAARQFGYRVNLAYKDGEQATQGYDWRHQVATVSLDWRAGTRLFVRTNHEYAANDLPRLQPFFLLGPGVAVPEAPNAARSVAQPWDDFRTRSRTHYLRTDFALTGNWTLSAKVLHNDHDRPAVKNARVGLITSNSGELTLLGDQSGYGPKATSGQLLLNGSMQIGGTSHRLTVGANVLGDAVRNSVGSTALGAFASNLYAPVASPEPATIDVPLANTTRSAVRGVFISDVVRFSNRLSALAGVRHGMVRVTNYDRSGSAPVSNTTELWATAPTAALMFTPSTRAMLYANFAEGIEQGGVAPQGTVNEGQRMPGLRTRQYEMGGKVSLAGAWLTAAAFELSRPSEYVDATTRRYVQNGEQRHRGVELSLLGEVTPQLTLMGGAMVLDPVARVTGDDATEGKRPVGTPTHTANLWARYRVPLLTGFSVNAGGYFTSAQYLDAANTSRIPATRRFDVGAQYDVTVGSTAMSYLLGIDNVTNRHYWSSAQSGLLTLSNPRTLKFTTRIGL